MLKKEFKVNDYIVLKLESGNTNIYINNEFFNQCKFLLLNINIDEISEFDDIESIDEAADRLDHSLELDVNEIDIPAETEFWGHCSNLQVWVENDYNTKILHSNMSFPLLKALTEAGDPKAKKIFKDEIAKRFLSNYESVKTYLVEEGYLEFLTKEEKETIGAFEFELFVDYTNDAQEFLDKNELDVAIDLFNKALEYNPNSYEALNGLGRALKRKGRYEEAIDAYRKGLKISPYHHYLYSNISEVYYLKGDYDLALKYSQKAIDLFPKTYEAYFYQGNIYYSRGDFKRAIECFKSALDSPIYWHYTLEKDIIYQKLIDTLIEIGAHQEAEYYRKKKIDED